ncbi:MAG: O-antigen ligase family protein [Burkholderiales bacterium]|nr:O-antigen ligase family protein [Burkholderiales bacterium]
MSRYSDIHRQPLMTSVVRESPTLQMTDYFFLTSFFLLLFWALDPFRVALDSIPVIKRVPSVLLVTNFLFIVVARLMFRDKRKYLPATQVIWETRWLVLFSLFVIAGSAYARFVSHIDETFLTFGTYVLMAPLMYWYVVNSAAPMKLLRAVVYLFLAWASVAALIQLIEFRQLEAFHNREHLVLPVLAMFFYGVPYRWGIWFGAALIAVVAAAAAKNTAYMMAILSLSYMFGLRLWFYLRQQKDGFIRLMAVLGAIVLVTVVIAALALVYWKFKNELPSGNPEYRLHTYQLAWEKFLSSPIWGVGFTQEAVHLFGLFEVAAATQNLPTHSDPLDMLANGGLIGFGLWLAGILPVFWMGLSRVSVRCRELPWKDAMVAHVFWVMSVAGVLVCTFNPIYNLPNLAMSTWMQFGCLLASNRLCQLALARQT